jgi:hypothetical protein
MAKAAGATAAGASTQLITVDDISAGIDERRSPTLVPSDRARQCRNWALSEPGSLVPIPGDLIFTTTNLGPRRVQGGRRCYLAGGTFTVASDNGNVYKVSDAGLWGAAVLTGRSAVNPHFYPNNRDAVYLFDGGVPMKSVDGAVWTAVGIIAPTAAPVLTAPVASGSLVTANQYEVAYSYYDVGLTYESNGSPSAKITLTTPNLTIRVAVTASTDPQVDNIFIYCRNVTAGESVLRKAGQTANVTGSFDITTPSSFFPDGVPIPTNHDLPKAMKFGVFWRNRLWGVDVAQGNKIRFTEVFMPQAWPATYNLDIPFERGDNVRGLQPMGDALIVFGSTGIYIIIGQTSQDFEVRPAAGAVAGSFGFRAVRLLESGVLHASVGGVYLFDGAADRLVSAAIQPSWTAMVNRTAPDVLTLLAIGYHELRKEVRVQHTWDPHTQAPGEWVLDLERSKVQNNEAWTSTDRNIGGYFGWDGAETNPGDQGRLFSWPLDQAILNQEALGLSDNGNNRTFLYRSPALLVSPRRMTRFIEAMLEIRPAYGTFQLDFEVDETPVWSRQWVFSPGASLATYIYDDPNTLYDQIAPVAALSSPRRIIQTFLPLTADGLTGTLVVSYTGKGNPAIYTLGLAVVAEPAIRSIQPI